MEMPGRDAASRAIIDGVGVDLESGAAVCTHGARHVPSGRDQQPAFVGFCWTRAAVNAAFYQAVRERSSRMTRSPAIPNYSNVRAAAAA